MSKVLIVSTGTANMASVLTAIRRQGYDPTESTSAAEIERAAGVVVPGVGAFGAAMDRINSASLRSALIERIDNGQPTMAVCVGMQLLCASSEESPDSSGLGVIDDRIERLGAEQRVPHLGWNKVDPPDDSQFLEPGWAYFANSYRLRKSPKGWSVSTTRYGDQFISAMERGNVLACQFHPELSGAWGARVLRRWLAVTGNAA